MTLPSAISSSSAVGRYGKSDGIFYCDSSGSVKKKLLLEYHLVPLEQKTPPTVLLLTADDSEKSSRAYAIPSENFRLLFSWPAN